MRLLCDLYFGVVAGTMLLGSVAFLVCECKRIPSISMFCPRYASIKTGGSDTLLPAGVFSSEHVSCEIKC